MREYEQVSDAGAVGGVRTNAVVGCVGRGMLWLGLLGMATGAVYGAAFWIIANLATPAFFGIALIAFVIGGLVGIVIGLVLGGCLGFAVGIAARRGGTPAQVKHQSRIVALALALSPAIVVSIAIATAPDSLPTSVWLTIGAYCVFVIIVGLCVVWVSDHLAQWATTPRL